MKRRKSRDRTAESPVPKLKKGRAKAFRDRRPRHGPHLHGGPIFDREFFGATLGAIVEAAPRPAGHDLLVTVFLADGGQLDVCGVVKLDERYAVFAAYEGTGDDGIERTGDDVGFEAVPYELVLRCSVRASPAHAKRLGFGNFPGESS